MITRKLGLEKEILLKEIHHRVKNNLAVICSLLYLQENNIKDETCKQVFKNSRNRIKSMALVHEKLYQYEDLTQINFAEYLKDLADNLFSVYGVKDKIAFSTNLKDVRLPIDLAIPCGLIVNELISNSLRHAFPEGKDGKIHLTFSKENYDQITLTVSDNGVGFPANLDFRKAKSLGLKLVNIILDHQLKGTIELDKSKGTKFTISFSPLSLIAPERV